MDTQRTAQQLNAALAWALAKFVLGLFLLFGGGLLVFAQKISPSTFEHRTPKAIIVQQVIGAVVFLVGLGLQVWAYWQSRSVQREQEAIRAQRKAAIASATA